MDKTPFEVITLDVLNIQERKTGKEVTALKAVYGREPLNQFRDVANISVRTPMRWMNFWEALGKFEPYDLPDGTMAVLMLAMSETEDISVQVSECYGFCSHGYRLDWSITEKGEDLGGRSFMALFLPEKTDTIIEAVTYSK